MTPPMTLSTPPRANSLSPDSGLPYSVYTVEVSHPGYTPVSALHVTMFSGVPAVLPVPLTPLPEQTTTSSGSSMPALNKGMRGKRMLVG